MTLFQVAVLIPSVMPNRRAGQFHESNSTLDETSREQALSAKSLGPTIFRVKAVSLLRGCRFVGQVGDLRDRHLHPISEIVVRDGGFNRVVLPNSLQCRLVELLEKGQFVSLKFVVRFNPLNIRDRPSGRIED